METLTAFLKQSAAVVFGPAEYLLDPSRRIYVGFLVSSFVLAGVYYLGRRRTFRGLSRYLFDPRLWWARSTRLDYKILFANGVLRKLLIAPLLAGTLGGAMAWAAALQFALGAAPELAWPKAMVAAVYTATLFIVDDFSRYLLHRAMHRVPTLWELHKVHHSAELLTPLTLYRIHPVESLLSALRNGLVTMVVVGGFFYLFRAQLSLVELFGVNAIGFVLTAAASNLRHSHVPLSFGRKFEYLFVSPVQHQIHHSRAQAHADKNYGSLLAVWDWMGGTLLRSCEVARASEGRLRFGLTRDQKNHELNLGSAYLDPLRRIFRRRLPRPLSLAVAGLVGVGCMLFALHARADSSGSVSPESEPPGQVSVEGSENTGADAAEEAPAYELGAMSIFGSDADVARIAGSAHVVDEKALAQFEDDDPHRVLARVPGVYVRGEDGYGLRPNIGMRGAISDRSKKVTLLEDGILLGPAPYAAPAAYYFPLLTRMTTLEVFKGPAAIQHGPQTIGGAINLVSRAVPAIGHRLGVDLAYGSDAYGKWHGYYGYGDDRAGVLIEAVRLRSDGFKELIVAPGVDDRTGFDKTEVMAKARVGSNPDADVFHEGRVKFGFSHEDSNETYLGLSDADFAQAPLERYAASHLDRMRNHRLLAEAGYRLVIGKTVDLDVALYRHRFTRSWFKLNSFRGGPSVSDVLAAPDSGARKIFYDVLTGEQDAASDAETLLVGDNHRSYVSQGVQAVGLVDLPTLGPVEQRLRVGLRYHNDEIRREHTEDSFLMRSSRLQSDGAAQKLKTDNLGQANAVAAYLVDEIQLLGLMLTPGVRIEHIRTNFEDYKVGTAVEQAQQAVLPGIGALYTIIGCLSAVAGVYQGFSPVAPGQGETARPELSVNYEAGLRFARGELSAEAVGFYNDYSNITGECTFSSGCSVDLLDQQFDGGEARVAGVEASVRHRFDFSKLSIPIQASYTFTHTELLTSFTASNPLFGEVSVGDEMPYVPRHQAALLSGVHLKHGGINFGGSYMSGMREAAGHEPLDEVMSTDDYFVLDALAYVRPVPKAEIYLKVDNVLNDMHIVSHRPYGARPGRPRFIQLGMRAEL